MSRAKPYPEIIAALKQKKKELGYSNQSMVDGVLAAGKFVSKPTADRVFKEGSENTNFRYIDSLQPFVEVYLMDGEEQEETDDPSPSQLQIAALQASLEAVEEIKSVMQRSIDYKNKAIKWLAIALSASILVLLFYLIFVDIPNGSIGLIQY